MKWRRLWQPQRLMFWQMLAFNILSNVCTWGVRALPLNTAGTLLLSALALANVAFSLLAARALLHSPAPGEAAAQPAAPPSGSSASTASTSE